MAQEAVKRRHGSCRVGAFFPSSVKPEAVKADPFVISRRRAARFAVPIVAIGGITPQNGGTLIEAGADALAVITALFGTPGH